MIGIFLCILDMCEIYINENLTEWRAELFKELRKVRKKNTSTAWLGL